MRRLLILLAAAAVWVLPATASDNATLDSVLNATNFRNIGPCRTSAWVTEIAVPETPEPSRFSSAPVVGLPPRPRERFAW